MSAASQERAVADYVERSAYSFIKFLSETGSKQQEKKLTFNRVQSMSLTLSVFLSIQKLLTRHCTQAWHRVV
jgi:hypothetical protein